MHSSNASPAWLILTINQMRAVSVPAYPKWDKSPLSWTADIHIIVIRSLSGKFKKNLGSSDNRRASEKFVDAQFLYHNDAHA